MTISKAGIAVMMGCMTALACAQAVAANATDWPTRPVTMVVPFPAGGATDIVGRLLAKELTQRLGQTFVVENKGGANATIGMQYVANAQPDGYTILYNTSSLALSPALYKKLSFDPMTSFTAVSTTATVPLVLLVNNSLPVSSAAEFVAYARAHPGKLNYASSGNGNVTHLAAFLFNKNTGIQAQHVPYKGTTPALVDLMGGQVQYMIGTVNDALPHIQANKVKTLAMTTASRLPILPDVPTVNESVSKGFDLSAWQGVMVPAGVAPEVVQRLNGAIRDALKSPEFVAQLDKQGAVTLGSTPQEYAKYLDQQLAYWKTAVREAGVEQE